MTETKGHACLSQRRIHDNNIRIDPGNTLIWLEWRMSGFREYKPAWIHRKWVKGIIQRWWIWWKWARDQTNAIYMVLTLSMCGCTTIKCVGGVWVHIEKEKAEAMTERTIKKRINVTVKLSYGFHLGSASVNFFEYFSDSLFSSAHFPATLWVGRFIFSPNVFPHLSSLIPILLKDSINCVQQLCDGSSSVSVCICGPVKQRCFDRDCCLLVFQTSHKLPFNFLRSRKTLVS